MGIFKLQEGRKSTLSWIVVCFIVVFMISFASAFEFDNKIIIPDTTYDNKLVKDYLLLEKYPPIEIINYFGLGNTLFEGYLSQHNDVCGIDCKSTMQIHLPGEGVLVDEVIFKTLQDDNSWIEQNVRSYQFSYWGTVDDYENICILGKPITFENETVYIPKECEQVLTGTHEDWINYNLGKIMPPGIYTLKLDAQKKPSRTVDWIIKTNGKWLESWATWGNISEGDDAEVILNSPVDDSTFYNNPVTFNATANVTSGATLVNISLFTNETGTWGIRDTTNIFGSIPYNNIFGSILYNNFSDGADYEKVDGEIKLPNANWTGNLTTLIGTTSVGARNVSFPPTEGWAFGCVSEKLNNCYFRRNNLGFRRNNLGNILNTNLSIQYLMNSRGGAFGEIRYYDSGDSLLDSTGIIENNSWNTINEKIPETTDYIVFFANGTLSGGYSENFLLDYINIEINPQTSYTTTCNKTINEDIIWNVQSCDSDDDCGFATNNYSLFIDTTSPSINLTYPPETIDYNYVGNNETLNWTVNDTNLESCWYDYNGTNTTITCGDNTTEFILETDNFNLTFYANDTWGNLASEFQSWTYNLIEISQTYPTTSIESATEIYTANLTYDSSTFSVITGSLILNGTEYTGTGTGSGGSAIFTANAIMPGVNESTNLTAYWTIDLTDVSGTNEYNLTSHNVTVEIINLSLCDASNNVAFWNFTILNESNLAEINSTFEATFTIRSSGSTVDNVFSFSDTTGNYSTFDFCISPGTESYIVDANIKLTKSGYVDKFYNYQEVALTNATREDNLYMMASADSTSFIVHVVYVDGSDIEGAEVKVQRYYPGTDDWLTTEILTTNYGGEAIGHLLSEDADYKFLVYLDGVSIHNSSATKIVCAIAPCTVTLKLLINVLTGYETVEDLTSTLTHSDTTNTFTYTYSDSSGDFTQARLYVIRSAPSNATIVIPCDTTKTTESGVITCDITGLVNGTYVASGYITRDGDEFLDKRISRVLGTNIYNSMGLDGVLWSIFILMGIVMLGISRPSLTIIFGVLGLILVTIMGIINIGVMSLVAVSAIAIILLSRIGKE